ncbi:MAG TPA: glycosyltransferase family 87 protein [Stellaceae bacterium]|nr:glycosyltransferase family 87 protein [Stellaceae bacterium]
MVSAGLRFYRALGNSLDHGRIVSYCGILLAIEISCFLFLVAGTHGLITPLSAPTSTDFVSFYAAGSLADAGTPELVYDQAAHGAAEERATESGVEYRFFYYPPVFLLLCAPLARLPYLVAFLVFEGATLILYLIVVRSILDECSFAGLVPILAFPAVFWTLGLGQNAFLTAALFGAGTLCIDRRPIAAGLLFGALCYKPHFGLLVPVALAAGGHWRAFIAAFAAAAGLCLSSLMLFGWVTWSDFFTTVAASHATYESGRVAFGGLVSPFGAVLLLGGNSTTAYAVQAGATLSAGLLVGFVWRSGHALPIRAATLAAATLVAIPVILIYDLMLAAVAVVWLVSARNGDELRVWEKVALAGSFLLLLDPRDFAEVSHVPVAPLVGVALIVAVATRVFCSETRSARFAAA